jgi:hypothetical protein
MILLGTAIQVGISGWKISSSQKSHRFERSERRSQCPDPAVAGIQLARKLSGDKQRRRKSTRRDDVCRSGGINLYLRYTESFKTFVPIVLPVGVAVVSSGDYRFEYVPETEALAELANTKPLELDRKNP